MKKKVPNVNQSGMRSLQHLQRLMSTQDSKTCQCSWMGNKTGNAEGTVKDVILQYRVICSFGINWGQWNRINILFL